MFLGYVPMDAVWAVATPESGLSALADLVIQALEGTGWQYADALYSHLLPTIGPRIVPTLFQRLSAVSYAGDILLENRIIGAIVTFPESDTTNYTAELLKTGAPLAKRAALKILAKRPNPKLLDEIWKLRCETQDNFVDFLRTGDWKGMLETECRQAIAAAVPFDVPWLEHTVERANPHSEPVHDLAYVLASLDDAAHVWRAHKSVLFAKVQPPQHRSLALNIYVYRDVDEVNWLIGQLGRPEDLIGATAFRALIRINPDLALEHLLALPEQELYFTRFWCFGELLASRPEATLSRICEMMKGHPRPRNLAQVFQGQEYALDERTLDILLNDLEVVLDDELAGRRDPHRAELWGVCELLSKANCLHQLRQFWKRQGTELEEKLTSWLLKRGWFSGGSVDTEARLALDVLYKFGGAGFTHVVNAYLDSEHRFGCLHGTDLAVKRSDEATIQKLVRVSCRDDLWEGKHALVQGHATKALAGLGCHKEVIDSLARWGLRTLVPHPVGQFRAGFHMPEAIPYIVHLRSLRAKMRESREPDAALAVVTDDHVGDSETAPAVMKQCLDALADGAPPGALLALGVYGSVQHAELVRRILANAAPNSDTAKAGIIALGLLRDGSREATDLIGRQMPSLDHPFLALRALSRIDTGDARTVGLWWLESQYQVELAADLLDYPATRDAAAELTRRYLSSAEPFHWGQAVEKLVQYVRDDQLLTSLVEESQLIEHLHERSFAEEGGFWFVGSKATAILGLARFDPGAAFWPPAKPSPIPDRMTENTIPTFW